uniref:RNA recognition motif-containing protein n=6 Tax=Toxoplasma gondii TaxID=5811 RepID=A0A2T6IP60_TOXGO|nr:RNA recognition motif-containing protein [Toxoplasma gondii TgCATBr9]
MASPAAPPSRADALAGDLSLPRQPPPPSQEVSPPASMSPPQPPSACSPGRAASPSGGAPETVASAVSEPLTNGSQRAGLASSPHRAPGRTGISGREEGEKVQGGPRGEKVYGGLQASLFPPLSAATAPPRAHAGVAARSDLVGGPPSLWEVYFTPDSNIPYFYNALSKHVQWHRPLPPKEYVDQLGHPDIPELNAAQTPPPPGVGAKGSPVLYGPLGSNLFVYHIPPEWTEQQFFRHFAPFGNVISCKIQTNAQTGKRSGFGFVSYDNQASAIAAIRAMNGYAACGKFLKVQLKKGEEHLLPPDLAA